MSVLKSFSLNFAILGTGLGLLAATQARAQSPSSSNKMSFYTTYLPSADFPGSLAGGVQTLTCGDVSTPPYATGYYVHSYGCFGSALLSGDKIVGVKEGAATTVGNVQTRNIYALDAGGAGPTVRVFTQTLSSDQNAQVTDVVTQTTQISLGLGGNQFAKLSMELDPAGNYLYVGSDQAANGLRIKLADYSVQQILGFSSSAPPGVSSITSNGDGYIAVAFGKNGGYVFNPDGTPNSDGGLPFTFPNTALMFSSDEAGVKREDIKGRVHVQTKSILVKNEGLK